MAYIILSDIHGNLEAFEAVVNSFPKKKIDRIICAGDIVGYGADPAKCIALLHSVKGESVLGNHDAGSVEKTDISRFNEYAREAVLWTRGFLEKSDKDYLGALPLVRHYDTFTVVHGTLHDPEQFIYMASRADAASTFEILTASICFIGHSHRPCVFKLKDGNIVWETKERITLEENAKYIINVGSVGQPRDRDPRACYCIYYPEKNEVVFHRVEYDVETARRRIIDAGLPRVLGERLLYGE